MEKLNSNETLANHLKERVKELSCLYALSKVSQQLEVGLDQQINKMIAIIPQGWQYPDHLEVSLVYNHKQYGADLLSKGIEDQIIVGKKKGGDIAVGYKNLPDEFNTFLKEEKQLLHQICLEVGNVISRHEQIKQDQFLKEKMQREDRLHILSELTAGVAHELNTPLGNIMGYAEILKKTITDKSKKADAEKIVKSALSAREIVKKLMYFSCEMPINFKPVNINDLILETCNLLSLQFKKANNRIVTEFDKNAKEVRGDNMQLTQVFINILVNAKDASASGQNIYVKTVQKNNSIEIEIKDNGEGIKDKDLEQLFKPFYTTKKQGTGLGLSVVHGIILSHNGTINVTSNDKTGTVFKITFPTLES